MVLVPLEIDVGRGASVRPNENKDEPPRARARLADFENCFIKLNLHIATVSGWLRRLVRRLV